MIIRKLIEFACLRVAGPILSKICTHSETNELKN